LPAFDSCAECGIALSDQVFRQEETMGLACRQHAGLPRHPVLGSAMQLLRTLRATSGRDWPSLNVGSETRAAATLTALWLAAAVEQRSPYRRLIFSAN